MRITPNHYLDTIDIAGLLGCKSVTTPGIVQHQIETDTEENQLDNAEHHRFRSLVGRLFSNCDVRVDLLTAVREAARASAKPYKKDIDVEAVGLLWLPFDERGEPVW